MYNSFVNPCLCDFLLRYVNFKIFALKYVLKKQIIIHLCVNAVHILQIMRDNKYMYKIRTMQ